MAGAPFIDPKGDPSLAAALDADALPDPLVGTTLAETYRIDAVLADGGMGRLYRGFHLRLELPVAIKVVHSARGHRSEAVERAEREARSMADIQSENVVRVLDLCRTPDKRPCMVTELLEGEDLDVHLETHSRLPVDRALEIGISICRGLVRAHERGLIHRDLKPSNVFLARDGEREVVKLLDFGVAKLEGADGLTQAGAFVGTPAFMAPEQAQAASDVDERADVYATGAILYTMLAGTPPYGSLDTTQTLMSLLKGDPPPITSVDSTIPSDIAAMVEAAMARDPKDRLSSADVLLERLVRLRETERTNATPRAIRWARVRAISLTVLAALVFCGWLAALTGSIVVGGFEPAEWPSWATILLRAIAPVVALGLLGGMVRSLIRAWKSAPRVERLGRLLAGALIVGLVTHALVVLGVASAHWFMLDASPLFPFEHLSALIVAGALSAGFMAVKARR